MKVKENKEEIVKKKFEPFSFTVDVQTEEELIELYHRFINPSGKLLKMYDNGFPPRWSFNTNNCEDIRDLILEKFKLYDVIP